MASSSLARRLCQLSIAASPAARSISTTAGRSAEAVASEASSSSSSSSPSSSSPSSSSRPSTSDSRPRRTERDARGGGAGRQGRDTRRGSGPRQDLGSRDGRSRGARDGPYTPSMSFLFRNIDKQGIAKTYEEFVEKQGKGFKRPPPEARGPHWLSDMGPFPLNPTFRPPPPTAQKVRDQLWNLHTSDPAKHSVRALSSTFGLTMERTQAILRLRAMESELEQQSTPLQYHFQYEMERLMGSKTDLPASNLLKNNFPRRPGLERQADPEPVPTKEATLFALDSRGLLADDVSNLPDGVDFGDSIVQQLMQEQRANNRRRRTIKTGDAVIRPRDALAIKAVAVPPSPFTRRRRRRAPIVLRDLGGSVQVPAGTSLAAMKRSLEMTKPSYPGVGTVEKLVRRIEKRRLVAATPRLRDRAARRRVAVRQTRNLYLNTPIPKGMLQPKQRRELMRRRSKESHKVLRNRKLRRALNDGDLEYIDEYAAVHLKDPVFSKRMGKGWKRLRRAITKPSFRKQLRSKFVASGQYDAREKKRDETLRRDLDEAKLQLKEQRDREFQALNRRLGATSHNNQQQ